MSSRSSRLVLMTPSPALGHFSSPLLNSLYFHIPLEMETSDLALPANHYSHLQQMLEGEVCPLGALPVPKYCSAMVISHSRTAHPASLLTALSSSWHPQFFSEKLCTLGWTRSSQNVSNDSQRAKHLSLCPAQQMLNSTALPVSHSSRSRWVQVPQLCRGAGFVRAPLGRVCAET